MLMDLLNEGSNVAMLSFVVSSMLAMGSGLLLGQIVEPLRNVWLVVLGLVANFMLMPLSAFVLAWVNVRKESRAAGRLSSYATYRFVFADVKNRERNSLSPNTRPIALNEKNGIKPIEMTIVAKSQSLGLPSPICGKLSLIGRPLNFPTTTSSAI